jgi:hypothetical protein
MSTYSLEASLGSCSVSKKLIQQLERYVLEKAAGVDNFAPESARTHYQLEVIDLFGTERISSIQDYNPDRFSNDTIRVAISYRNWDGRLRNLKLGFGQSEYLSKIEVEIEGTNAREIATGIVHEVKRLLKDFSNLNFVFYGKYAVLSYLVGGLGFGMLLGEGGKEATVFPLAVSGFGLLGLWILWIGLKSCNPYIIFETAKNERRQDLLGWILKSLAGIIVFGGLAKLIW